MLYVLELEAAHFAEPEAGEATIEAHTMNPAKVLRLAATLGDPVRRILLVGCEPTPADDADDMRMEMSARSRGG